MTEVNKNRIAISKIDKFPRVIFGDLQCILANQLTPNQKNSTKGRRLSDYCNMFGVEDKDSMSYARMNQMFCEEIHSADFTDVLGYAV
jgi:hypothetical protein